MLRSNTALAFQLVYNIEQTTTNYWLIQK